MLIFNGMCCIQDLCFIILFQMDVFFEGGGGYYNGDYFYINWLLDLLVCVMVYINVKEFIVIFLFVCRWGKYFVNSKVIIYSDNFFVVLWINKGIFRIFIVQFMCCILFWIFVLYNCVISVKYLLGK